MTAARAQRFEELYNDQLPAVIAYARRRVAADQVEDVVGEVFLQAWRRIDVVPADALPWVFGIARGVVANHRRGQKRFEALRERISALPAEAQAPPTVESIDPDLAAALLRLPEEERELLCLLAWEHLSREQAASALGCSQTALRLRLMRARRRLDRELERQRQPSTTTKATSARGKGTS